MKTPQELADKWANHMFLGSNPDAKRAIELAIEADRAQRDIYELIAETLDERARGWCEEMPVNAAERIREGREDDCLWGDYIGPMLDRMTEELGA